VHFLKTIFRKKRHVNPAINELLYTMPSLDPKAERMVSKLSDLSQAYQEGGAYLLQKALLGPIGEYDGQFGSGLSETLDEAKKGDLLKALTSLMLHTFFKEVAGLFSERAYASSFSQALHFEIYDAAPEADSFIDYLNYQNPNFDDPTMVPAYKFGNDVAAILQVPDLSFSFMVAQQAVVICDISKRLMRWVLFDEPMDGAPTGP